MKNNSEECGCGYFTCGYDGRCHNPDCPMLEEECLGDEDKDDDNE